MKTAKSIVELAEGLFQVEEEALEDCLSDNQGGFLGDDAQTVKQVWGEKRIDCLLADLEHNESIINSENYEENILRFREYPSELKSLPKSNLACESERHGLRMFDLNDEELEQVAKLKAAEFKMLGRVIRRENPSYDVSSIKGIESLLEDAIRQMAIYQTSLAEQIEKIHEINRYYKLLIEIRNHENNKDNRILEDEIVDRTQE